MSKRLRVYKILINWNMPKDPREAAQANPSPAIQIQAQHWKHAFLPSESHSTDLETSAAGSMDGMTSAQLTHLEFIAPAPEQGSREQTYPTVMATFATTPSSPSVIMDTTNQYTGISTVVCRWLVKPGQQNKLSPCFDQLNLNKRKQNTSAIAPRASHLRV